MIIDKAVFRTERGTGPGYWITVMLLQFLFGILAAMIVAWFSRWREFRADRGSANLLGSPRSMIAALARLGSLQTQELPPQLKSFGIAGGIGSLLASHPPIEARIAALQAA
jgi:heat shock protein HtpX